MAPVFAEFENSSNCGRNFRTQEFINGFTDGRNTYIKLNGPLSKEIPSIILTPILVEHYFICGQIGDDLIIQNSLSKYQNSVVELAYNNGRMQFSPDWNFSLIHLLRQIGIASCK